MDNRTKSRTDTAAASNGELITVPYKPRDVQSEIHELMNNIDLA